MSTSFEPLAWAPNLTARNGEFLLTWRAERLPDIRRAPAGVATGDGTPDRKLLSESRLAGGAPNPGDGTLEPLALAIGSFVKWKWLAALAISAMVDSTAE